MSLLAMPSVAASQVPSSTSSLLLLVWLHGFKGGDDTFESFPERLTFLLSETWPQTKCTSIIYPAYDTRGSLSKATELFLDWLTVKTTEHETAHANLSKIQNNEHTGRDQAYVVLLGHSMGGLLIADATLKLIRERDKQSSPEEGRIWPGIIGLMGYDTPYYGLNPAFFANAANEYIGHAKTAQQVITNLQLGLGAPSEPKKPGPSTGRSAADPTQTPADPPPAPGFSWMKLGLAAAGVAGLAVAAGTTYLQKDNIVKNVGWATSHLDYVKELFETDRLNQRMSEIIKLKPAVNFHCFYTEIPKVKDDSNRHFITLPTPTTVPKGIEGRFSANQNLKAQNEINAHTTMFNQNLNSGYWDLGRESARLISEWFRESQQLREHRNQKQDPLSKDESIRSSDDVERRDRLAKDASARLDAEIGDQQSRDEL